MKKIKTINKVINKIKRKFSIETIMKNNKLQTIFNKIIAITLTVFVIFTIISTEALRYSYINQSRIYEEGYLASNYANKINNDILQIITYSSKYSVNYDKSIVEELKTFGKDIDDNISLYKQLNNVSNYDIDTLDELTKKNNIYKEKVSAIIYNISNSRVIKDSEIAEIIYLGENQIQLSEKLIENASSVVNALNTQNEKIKNLVISITIIINIMMISLFMLIISLVTKISRKTEYYAFYSSITGLPNKNYVLNTLVKEISRLPKNKYAALISLDLDNFKAINDNLGHSFGDEFLKQAGARFKKAIDIRDSVCHVGADEFLFFVRSVNNREEVDILVEKLQNALKEHFYIKGKKIDYITASLGVVLINQDGQDFESLYNCADDAMYESKRTGKNKCSFYDKEMYSNVYEKTIKRKEIEEGIKKGEFKVFYQPKVSNDEKILGAEALVRWIKDDNKIIPPSEFIEFAENEGLIQYIGEAVIIEVCIKIEDWIKKGYKDFRIAVNLSAEQIINEELCDKALNIIRDFEIPFEYIEFEVTESSIIKDFDIAINNIKKIRSYGIKVSLDDFGTGYSSLNYLKNLEVDSVKLDKTFIDNLVFDDASNVMVNSIIRLCHYFGYQVVAEGVEKREQIECLKDLNCDIFQGYYFGKPVNEVNFEKEFLFA